jgi:hypothetical protein
VAGDVLAGTAALEMSGSFGGDVQAYVDATEETDTYMPMNMYMTDMPISIPSILPGLSIADSAQIAGDLEYTSTVDLPIPAGVVGGEISRERPVSPNPERIRIEPTPAQRAGGWGLDLLRSIVTLILFGLLIGWLFPSFLKGLTDKVQAQPAASLGWGLVSYAAFFFLILLVVIVMILGGIFFGALTLGGISGTIIGLGLLLIFSLIVGFILVSAYLTKIVIAQLSGRLILGRIDPALADHKFWPLILGVVLVALLAALPFVGWLFGLVVLLLGLGALWLWGRAAWQARQVA